MNWKRSCLEYLVASYVFICGGRKELPQSPRKIFVLRNNDIGDLLIITPIFAALKKRFPETEIIAGIGDWNRDVLENNPWIDTILSINAPWHNKFTPKPRNPFRRLFQILNYIFTSEEVAALRKKRVDVGIDVTGTWEGALLFNRAGIKSTIGVKGYGGGHLSSTACIPFDLLAHVGEAALNQARLLGVTEFPEARPQLFLTDTEIDEARKRWSVSFPAATPKILIFLGAGFPMKCRSPRFFRELIPLLLSNKYSVALAGSSADGVLGTELARDFSGVENWCGQMKLRQSFAATATCDVVITHSSMALQVAAAFKKPTLVLLTALHRVEDHQRVWGYPYPCVTLGLTTGLTESEEAQQAFEHLRQILPV